VLGTQVTGLFATAYTFPTEAAVGLVVSYAVEGDATINGATAYLSSKRVLTWSVAGLVPINDTWRVQGSLFLNPPFDSVGANQPTTGGLTFTLLHSWS
jgi:hypothetical protein